MKMFAVMNICTGARANRSCSPAGKTPGRGLSLHQQSKAQAAVVPCGKPPKAQ
jgi:hypothetical protein